MTPAAPQPAAQQQHQQQHQHANAPPPPTTPVASPIQAAVSPPNKRDLKSWWKNFKLPSKHQESHGTAVPSKFTTRAKPRRIASIFVEDRDGCLSQTPPSLALLRTIVSDEEKRAVHRASAAMNLPSPSRPPEAPKLRAFARLVPWRFGACARTSPPKSRGVGTKLMVAEPRPHGIFGVPLRQSITYANVAISLVDEEGKSYIYGYVPIVVAKCGVFLKERATEVEGIFRLSGSEKRIKELKTIFDSPDRYGKGLIWEGYTVHDAANVLRRYLNDLPEPVVPLDLYEKFREPLRGATRMGAGDVEGPQFVENFDMDAAIIRYQRLITELPPLNRQLLLYILDLLAVFAAKSNQNRMTSQNLAAIFQPGMLSHPAHAMAPEEYRLNQCVIIFLIENQDHFLIGMQGTAADEKTVEEVQKGTPVLNPPSTPEKGGLVRSGSTASAGAESVAREGSIRRNKSISSRRSFQSNGCPSPGSPALAATPTSGLARSNTLPSKKSPALQSGRFAHRNDPHLTPLTPVAPPATTVVNPPAVVEEVATPPEESVPSIPTSTAPSSSQTGLAVPGARSQDRLLEPFAPEPTTPSKERKLPILFQRIAASDGDGRQPNKLRKKRLPGSANPSAHSSSASLPHSTAASPSVESPNPLETIPSVSKLANPAIATTTPSTSTPSEPTPRAAHTPPSSAELSHTQPSSTNAGHSDPRPSHSSSGLVNASSIHADTLHPSSAQATLRSKKSPPTSLHSSFNESSDLDQIEELPTPPTELPAPDTPSEKEKKRRWRLSRKKEETSPPPFPSFTSPRQGLGSNAHADVSTTSVGSSSYRPRASMSGDVSDRITLNTEAPLVEVSSKESKDESKKLTSWLKTKYREHKENAEQRRNKSPPGERNVSLGSSLMSSRGKSLDLKRGDEEKQQVQEAPPMPQLLQPPQQPPQAQPTPPAQQGQRLPQPQHPPQMQQPSQTQQVQGLHHPQPQHAAAAHLVQHLQQPQQPPQMHQPPQIPQVQHVHQQPHAQQALPAQETQQPLQRHQVPRSLQVPQGPPVPRVPQALQASQMPQPQQVTRAPQVPQVPPVSPISHAPQVFQAYTPPVPQPQQLPQQQPQQQASQALQESAVLPPQQQQQPGQQAPQVFPSSLVPPPQPRSQQESIQQTPQEPAVSPSQPQTQQEPPVQGL
ncbi:GTPase activating protein (GAP) for Rho1p [Collariella sp. IMI 366227]|nr:GTPase activating protein (GAP) for Rho1p [Collariella sp. IMI 366227]